MGQQTSVNQNQQSAISNHQPEIENPKRPFGVTLIALAVLTIAVIHLIRLVEAIRQWEFLAGLSDVLPLYQTITGFIWLLAGLPLAWGLLYGKRWAPVAARWIVPAYIIYAWIDRIFVANPAVTIRGNAAWPFMAVVTLVSLLFLYWILSRSRTRAYFRSNS